MGQELIPYNELARDDLEDYLSEQANKPQIHYERRHGLEITVYYLRKVGEVSMSLCSEENYREFIIPNDKVNDAIAHPEYYAQLGEKRNRVDEWDGK